ncbi:3,4-dihydroxy-2-butanone-4-phosphate synthase [Fructobacillus durionis]|uniref:3,4-dihydroxy-2-butanone 4-phosphate synthase n=1 Tax=Fructobacillus durionis TaxID=283737 RepID=A0A1I1H9I2_9LACO|nr:3,4-dihydroxy-2-butanone-4-phosphate synthase [Fructobacillus durionis]SFC18133.1 3,4-dihydroxy-2-butanone 4-phosphate synthase [Fructobacillus durionis]
MQKILDAVEWLKKGGLLIVLDDFDRENEGDLLGLGQYITEDNINFMISKGRGLLCTPITEKLAQKLKLKQMKDHNTESNQTAFTVSIDGEYVKTGVTTGISVSDRTQTIRQLVKTEAMAEDFVQPGHTFPLVAKTGGGLERAGHTEAAIDLAKLAGSAEVGVIIEILMPDGQMARSEYLRQMSIEWNLPMITIADLRKHLLEGKDRG